MNADLFYGKLYRRGAISCEAASQVLGEKWEIYCCKCRNKHLSVHLQQLQPFSSSGAMEAVQLDSFTACSPQFWPKSKPGVSSENIKKALSNDNTEIKTQWFEPLMGGGGGSHNMSEKLFFNQPVMSDSQTIQIQVFLPWG